MNASRTIIIGNSGSGKSWLAERIARRHDAPWIDLDRIHWQEDGYNLPRDRDQAMALTETAAAGDAWVIEGIYGWLVEQITARADGLIWLCTDEQECVANIRRRGKRNGATAAGFEALLSWSSTYRSREGSSSFTAHQRLFDTFTATKICLRDREEITRFAGE
jgi:adenylate kinase family enzyme